MTRAAEAVAPQAAVPVRAVAVTHEVEPGDALVEGLRAAGVPVLEWPTVRTVPAADPGPLEEAVSRLDAFAWMVFTSRRAVEAVVRLRPELPSGLRIGAVGPRVLGALEAAGWSADAVGDGGAARLAGLLASRLKEGEPVLFPAGALAADTLEDALTAAGARVTRVEAYGTDARRPDGPGFPEALPSREVAAVTFLSPSAVKSLLAAVGTPEVRRALVETPVVCVGDTTAAAATSLGFTLVHTAAETSKSAVAAAAARLATAFPSVAEPPLRAQR